MTRRSCVAVVTSSLKIYESCMQITPRQYQAALHAQIGSALLDAKTQVIAEENWYQVLTPKLRATSHNEVILSTIPKPGLEARVEKTFQMYAEHELPFEWCTGPMSAPEIEPLIRGRAVGSSGFKGMVSDTDVELSKNTDIDVEAVTLESLDEFLKVYMKAWEITTSWELVRANMSLIFQPRSIFKYYVARRGDAILGVGGTCFKGDHGYLVAGAVLPEYRGAGVYRALLQERLVDLRIRAIRFAVIQAAETTSAPILEKLGFKTAFRADLYRF